MTITQNNNGHEEAANSSNAANLSSEQTDDGADQKVVLLPRKAGDPKTFWIGVLAKYFDIWVPTSPVRLKEAGSSYTFDFYSESRSKLVKIFTPADEKTIGDYLDLPYAEHILFIMDLNTDAADYDCRYCGDCDGCNHVDELAEEMGAYLCRRKDADISYIMGENDEGDWDEVKPCQY